jgi:hypothetical protein
MKKRMAGIALAASLLAAIPVSSAQAQVHCVPFLPDNPGCLVKCLVNWTADFVTSGGGNPGYTCSDWN